METPFIYHDHDIAELEARVLSDSLAPDHVRHPATYQQELLKHAVLLDSEGEAMPPQTISKKTTK